MKHTIKSVFKNPSFIINALLLSFLGALILNANAEQLHLPLPVKQALAAVAQITGSGTANKLAVFAAENQIGNSSIFDNGANIGIGTTDPRMKVHVRSEVQGANGATVAVDGPINAQVGFSWLKERVQRWTIFTPEKPTSARNDLILWEGDEGANFGAQIDRMTFQAVTGNIGIGTRDPQKKLDVVGDVKLSGDLSAPGNTRSAGSWVITNCVQDCEFMCPEGMFLAGVRTRNNGQPAGHTHTEYFCARL